MNWTFGRKLALGFALAVTVLLGVGAMGYRNIGQLVETSDLVAHTQHVIQRLTELESRVKDSETAVRGYAISGSASMLEPHLEAQRKLEELQRDLKNLVADNRSQTERLQALAALIDEKMARMENNIETRQNEGFEATVKVISSGEGNRLMLRIRQTTQEMIDAENQLLSQRTAVATSSATATKAVILWGSLLGTLLIVIVGTQISSSLTRQIGAAVGQIQASSTELQAAANQQAAGASEQATAVSEITTTIGELLATSRQIAESAQRVSAIAARTADAAKSGDGTVNQGSQSIQAIRRQVDSIVSQMIELGRKSQQIGAVLDIVAELAEQTNIVAVNATIEAVGAGDAGVRFFAVADEIRKLADRVGGGAKEIRTLIDEVRGAVNAGIMTTETGSKATEAGAQQFVLVAKSFGEINAQVATTTEAAREIELSTKQQSSAVEQVNSAILSVAQATKESEISTSQTLRTASELSRLSSQLLNLVTPRASAASASNHRDG